MSPPNTTPRRLDFGHGHTSDTVNRIFRYPAKFHPPAVASLLERYTNAGDLVLDPFVGSGTALVEGALRGRRMVGTDIDPVAATVALAKTRFHDSEAVLKAREATLSSLADFNRSANEYEHLMFHDYDDQEYSAIVTDEGLWVPSVPNMFHWFRRYVVVDLARILKAISSVDTDASTRLLLRVAFASIIRNASNADPVPVSGLEVTSHMLRREAAGRQVDPYGMFKLATARIEKATSDFTSLLPDVVCEPVVAVSDALALPIGDNVVDAVVTSPPYHNAVDYYRRHTLEMYWLGCVETHSDRLRLLPHYFGRPRVPFKNPLFELSWTPGKLTRHWEELMKEDAPRRASDFRHYVLAMTHTFAELYRVTRSGAPVLVVVGQSLWNGTKIPTEQLFTELAVGFNLTDILFYPVKNRYMSYSRRNNASIDTEFVLAFRRNR
jgi:DNA modification methylase